MVEVFWLLLIGARRIVAASSDFDNALFASDVLLKKYRIPLIMGTRYPNTQ